LTDKENFFKSTKMAGTSIEWTEMTWNPSTGCTKISSGCMNCYAEIMARRLKAMGVAKYKNEFTPTIHPDELLLPFSWKKPKMVFVNSMSDLFHEDIPLSFIKQVFKVMNQCQHHTFQILTKRADLLVKNSKHLNWTKNIWMGVTVEHKNFMHRIALLKQTPANIKFLSLEPLLSAIPNINLIGINWVIVGGESGHKPRPIQKDWVVNIKSQCELYNVPFFFKQWGGKNKKEAGNLLEGKKYLQKPELLETLA